ncbi:hypothetical protein ACIQOW_07330 [Kitasatospora sp. NPDC091335]|uniref:hypothetical protein n=2 Tax=unclassified Kitasatospora TaxID=2633591 RepID=UPI003819751B
MDKLPCRPFGDRMTAADGSEEGHLMAQAKKIGIALLLVFVLYSIITSPSRSAELVQLGFEGISNAAKAVGTFMTGLIK